MEKECPITGAMPENECCSTHDAGSCNTGKESHCSDPVEMGVRMWGSAFFDAMHELKVEILKAKMKKEWGQQMDKAGDALMTAMEAGWQSMMATAKAKADLKNEFRKIWSEKK